MLVGYALTGKCVLLSGIRVYVGGFLYDIRGWARRAQTDRQRSVSGREMSNMTDAVERRLAVLEDIRAIESLKWRYLRACDRKQPDAVRACFADGAVIDYEGFPLFTDPDAFVTIFREWGCQPNIIDMHHGQNPLVELMAPDSAQGWFDLYFFQIDTKARRHTQMAVSYDDRFVRKDGKWLIAHTVARRMSLLVKELGVDGVEKLVCAGRSDIEGELPAPR